MATKRDTASLQDIIFISNDVLRKKDEYRVWALLTSQWGRDRVTDIVSATVAQIEKIGNEIVKLQTALAIADGAERLMRLLPLYMRLLKRDIVAYRKTANTAAVARQHYEDAEKQLSERLIASPDAAAIITNAVGYCVRSRGFYAKEQKSSEDSAKEQAIKLNDVFLLGDRVRSGDFSDPLFFKVSAAVKRRIEQQIAYLAEKRRRLRLEGALTPLAQVALSAGEDARREIAQALSDITKLPLKQKPGEEA